MLFFSSSSIAGGFQVQLQSQVSDTCTAQCVIETQKESRIVMQCCPYLCVLCHHLTPPSSPFASYTTEQCTSPSTAVGHCSETRFVRTRLSTYIRLPYCYYYLRVLYFANFCDSEKIAKLSTRKIFYQPIRHSGVCTTTNCVMFFTLEHA